MKISINPILNFTIEEIQNLESDETKSDKIDIKYENECPVCLDELNEPYEMPCCENVICKDCFENWHISGRQISCVFCRFEDIDYSRQDEVFESINNLEVETNVPSRNNKDVVCIVVLNFFKITIVGLIFLNVVYAIYDYIKSSQRR